FSTGDHDHTNPLSVPTRRSSDLNETFFVNLSNPVGTALTDAQGTGTITNDDAAPTISIDDVTQAEGNAGTSTFTFTVTLSNPTEHTSTHDCTTATERAAMPDGAY